jgi:hypothetical protein
MSDRLAKTIANGRNGVACLCLLVAATQCATAQTADSGTTTTPPAPATTAANQTSYTPPTADEKFNGYLMGMFGPKAWLTGAASAGWGQLRDRPKEWGEGARGFGLRYGSGFAQRITRETLIFGASSLLHEDNRYIASGQATTGARIKYALESTFLAWKDDGTRTFSFSRIGGMAGSSLISRSWQPPSTSGMRSAGLNFSVSLAVTAGFNVAREFMPKKLRSK